MADFKVLDDDWYNFTSVSEAESMTYSQPCVVSVKETGRVYQFDAASSAIRDGIRVLTPAGGGRLLATKTGSDEVEIPKIGTTDHQSLTQSLQVGLSTGACNGNFVTDAGSGAINIAAGEGMIRAANSSDSAIFAFSWPGVNGVTIPLNSVRYVGVEYNSGSPQAVVRTSNNWNGQTEFQAATVVNEGGTLHILNNPQESCDGIQKIFHRLIETQPFQFAERIGGGRFSEIGTRNLSLSYCEFYDGLNEFKVTTKNTSTGDTFDAYYGSFTKVAAQTQWDNQNYDNAGTLTALSANRYGVHWLYIEMDDSFALVYGKGNYNTISDAEAALPPASLPLRLSLGSRLAAKLIFQKGAASAIQIESAFDVNFKSGMPVSHGDLSNINGNGDYHLSEAERDAAIRVATASQSGLASAALVQSVINSAVAGSSGQIQYNNNGVLGASTNLAWNESSKIIEVLDGSFQARTSTLGHKASFKTAGTLAAYPRAAFAIGAEGSVTNVAFWIYPDTGDTQTGAAIAVLTNVNTATEATKRLDINQTVSLSSIYSSSGTGNSAGTDLAFYTYGNANQLFLKNNGNTGVSTNNPSGRFDIHGAGTTTGITLQASDSAGNAKFTVFDNGLINASGGSVIDFNTFSTDTTLTQSSKSCAVTNPSGTGMVLTMHLSPPNGILQTIVNASSFAVTLGRNSQKIAGLESNYTLPANTSITLQFFGATLGWLIISNG